MYITLIPLDDMTIDTDSIHMGSSKDGKDGKDKDSEKIWEKRPKEKELDMSFFHKPSLCKNRFDEGGELISKDKFSSPEIAHQIIKIG